MPRIKVLHLSDTQLSGSPIRIAKLLNKYSDSFEARHLVFHPKLGYRQFEADLVAKDMPAHEITQWIFDWADIIHYHNRWARQEVFQRILHRPPKTPSVIQIHSPRNEGENFTAEAESGVPLAIIAQYHVRQWPELSFIVPNVVDIEDPDYKRPKITAATPRPIVSFAPSNTTAAGWNDKGYDIVAPVLKRLKLAGDIQFQLIVSAPHKEVMEKKRLAHIGIDEVVTGSYHLSSLEYLSLGVATFANIDLATEKVVKDLTGCERLPWLKATEVNFDSRFRQLLKQRDWVEAGHFSREWMERYWNPGILVGHYERMYRRLLADYRR
jgi:hypothetical protein